MGKIAEKPRLQRRSNGRHRLERLRDQRRQLAVRLAKVDAEISKIAPKKTGKKSMSAAELDEWFDTITAGLEELPPLPADFSRADLYNDHD